MKTKTMKEFNTNSYVYVNITKAGTEFLNDEIQKNPPIRDVLGRAQRSGYYELQMWGILDIFGKGDWGNGIEPLFETAIYLQEKDLKQSTLTF